MTKNAVIYGGGGAIGSAVAAVLAKQGVRVHLLGRTLERLKAAAAGIENAEVAVVDAVDEAAVVEHAESVVARFGSLDISLTVIARGDVQGTPLTSLPVEDFVAPVTNAARAGFITARTAARLMAAQGSGVIVALNSGSGHAGSPMMGGTGPADATIDSLVRNLAIETGPSGVRVVGVWVAGIPETLSAEALGAVNPDLGTPEALQGVLNHLDSLRMTKRSPRLAEVAETVAFLASDHARGITGTFVNVTGGMFS
ncbi:MAG: SDR family oxidoreductase [Actinophytocola sp.]|uniref:SDR family NAD(P)-dependent oxidoreductase n=1 Tax=Actinophytocola sp. TaxID=1872138 RepID=UPI003C72E42C